MRRVLILVPLLCAAALAAAQEPEVTSVPEATPSPSATPSPAPDDLAAQVEILRAQVERLREDLEAGASAGTMPSGGDTTRRETGLKTADLAARTPDQLRLGGVVNAAAVFAQGADSQFALPRAALFAFAPVGERVSFAGEVTALGGGAERIDADLSAPGRGDVFVQYAAADLVAIPDALSVRAGLVAVPFGRTNLDADESSRDLFIRPVDEIYLVPTPWFDVGAGLLGGVFVGPVRLEYQGYVLAGPGAGIDARTGTRNARLVPGADVNSDKALAGRVVARPAAGVEIGASGYSGAYSHGGGRRLSMAALDAALDASDVSLEGEAMVGVTQGGPGDLGLAIPKRMAGGSLQGTWRVSPADLLHSVPDALQGSSFGATVRWSFVDTDLDRSDTSVASPTPEAYTRRDRIGLGLSFRPVPAYVLRGEYEFRTEAGGNFVDDDRVVLSATAAF